MRSYRFLTAKDIQNIRDRYRRGESVGSIAARFGRSKGHIHRVLCGDQYANVPDLLGPIVMRPAGRQSERPLNAIGRERVRLGITVSEAATRIGMRQEGYTVLERDQGRKPRASTLARLKRAGYNVKTIVAELAADAEVR